MECAATFAATLTEQNSRCMHTPITQHKRTCYQDDNDKMYSSECGQCDITLKFDNNIS